MRKCTSLHHTSFIKTRKKEKEKEIKPVITAIKKNIFLIIFVISNYDNDDDNKNNHTTPNNN